MEESKMVLRTEDLVKKYGKRTVVSHVSIDVKQGEIVGLLGPNGAGKTTSFYMTVGLITPNEGRIFLDDYDIREYDAMTDGSVRGDTNDEIGVWAVGKPRVCEPGRPSIS